MCTATDCKFLWQYFSQILSKSVKPVAHGEIKLK